MDISSINNVQELKSMAYDQIAQKEQAIRNLEVINNRIVELSQDQPEEIKSEPDELASNKPEAI